MTVALEKPKPGDAKLAEEVRRVLEFSRLENPGRAVSFPRWESWLTTPTGGQSRLKLIHLGWAVFVTHVVRTGPDSWNAQANVFPLLKTEDDRVCSSMACHLERYAFSGGKLDLIEEAIWPEYDPDKGIPLILGH